MKRLMRCVTILLSALLLFGVPVAAAARPSSKYPDPIRVLKAEPATTSASLRWTTVSGADGYYVYQKSGSKYKQLKKVSSRKVKITGLKEGKTYKFAVKAYNKAGKKTYKSKTYKEITVKTKIKVPTKPTGFVAINNGSRQVGLNWNRVSGVNGYEIYQVANGKRKLVKRITNSSTKECTIGGLTNGKSSSFCMRSYRLLSDKRKVYSGYTSTKSATPKALSDKASDIHSIYYNAKTRRKVTVYNYTKKKNQILQSGTKVIAPSKTIKGYITCMLTNGQKIKIKGSDLRTYGYKWDSKTDYSKSAKEEMINSKNLVSETKYLIWASQYRCRINVFKGSVGNWKLIKAFKCGIGTYDAPSPKGIRKIYSKTLHGKYGVTLQWSNGGENGTGNTFHEPLGVAVGYPNSHGCFRMKMNDLMWMYNNIPIGTLVYSW